MELIRNFLQAKMDKDTDRRLLQNGVVRDFYNIRVASSEDSSIGSIENCLGNELLTNLSLGANAEAIGADISLALNNIYWLVSSDTGSYFIEFDIDTQTVTKVLEDTRVGNQNVLNLSKDYQVDRIIIIEDTDNNTYFATWTDNYNQPRFIDIEKAKLFGANSFVEDDILLRKKAPVFPPTLLLEDSGTSDENYFSEVFPFFAYRWKYENNQFSAISPFSEVAFNPNPFNYNYSTNTNEGMVNRFNQATITFNTGSDKVVSVELIVRLSESNVAYLSEAYVKDDEGWGNNQDVSIVFNKQKFKKALTPDELTRMFDAVPEKAGAIGYASNMIIFGDYLVGHNMINIDNNPIVFNFQTTVNLLAHPNNAIANIKSLRDYDIGIAYLDKDTRLTPLFTSKNGSFTIGPNGSDKLVDVNVQISHKPPVFATHYRLYVRESKKEFDTIVPTIFYQDGSYVWIKMESGDSNKINEGDYLIIKADSAGILSEYRETRVLEIVTQAEDFLREDGDPDDFTQLPGLYFRIQPDGFRFSEDDLEIYEFNGYDNTRPAYSNPIRGEANVIEKAVYYGAGGLNDLTESGTYTGTTDIRYVIEINSTGTPDNFRWSNDDGQTFSAPIAITGASQLIENGLSITFGSTTGHSSDDSWIVSAKSQSDDGFGNDENDFTYALFKSFASNTNINIDDVIEGGARISIDYNEYGEGSTRITKNYIASREYANLEEWWFGDNINNDFGYPESKIWFRRGSVGVDGNARFFTQDPTGDMTLILKSIADETGGDARVKASSTLKIIQSNQTMLLETKGTENTSDLYYELPVTYPITDDGYHGSNQVGDISQTASNIAVLNLPFANCFSWGNGFESYKIKDAFNGRKYLVDNRPWTFTEDYKQRRIQAGLFPSGGFEQTTRYNALNEFNLSLNNFLDLDDAFGPIERIHEKDSDITVFQRDQVRMVGIGKSQLFDNAGNASVVKSDTILNPYKPYTGEFGITKHSFAYYGNRLYGSDPQRGTPIRLSIDGITELNIFQTQDFFKDIFRQFPKARYEAGYNPYFDEYVLSVQDTSGVYTIGFSERVKGWVSRYAYVPEKMVGINNLFYSFKSGQLWQHNSENVPRNNFYGVQYNSSLKFVFNDSPDEDKIFKSLEIVGDAAWDVTLLSNLANSSISKEDFELRESSYYAHTSRNLDFNDASSLSTVGIGALQSINSNELGFSNNIPLVNQLDLMYQIQSDVIVLIGRVVTANELTITYTVSGLAEPVTPPQTGAFTYLKKLAKIEGGSIRGQFMEVQMTNDNTEKVSLFSVKTNAVKSYV